MKLTFLEFNPENFAWTKFFFLPNLALSTKEHKILTYVIGQFCAVKSFQCPLTGPKSTILIKTIPKNSIAAQRKNDFHRTSANGSPRAIIILTLKHAPRENRK